MAPASLATEMSMPMPQTMMMVFHGTPAMAFFSSPARQMMLRTPKMTARKVASALEASHLNTSPPKRFLQTGSSTTS